MVNDDASNCKKYGIPLYGAAWIPPSAAAAAAKEDGDTATEPKTAAVNRHIVLAGGGGEGHSGIPNAILISSVDYESNSLSDQPVARHETGSDLPYRIAVHPGGEGLICSLPKSCRWFDWDMVDEQTSSLKSSERVLERLQDVGHQLALTFNVDGTLLATGGEDGQLRVFKYPDMAITLDEANAHKTVKDLDFSNDGKYLVSVGGGSGRVWDVSTSTSIASLQRENDELFGYCRFARGSDEGQVLYVAAAGGKGGKIIKWNPMSWRRISASHICHDNISAFNVSLDGKLLAVGTVQGDVFIVSAAKMRVQTVVKKAHLGIVTTLNFSQDSRRLVSTSMDSSVRVTLIKDKKKDGSSLWIILFVILLAVAVYYAKSKGIIL